MNAHRHIALLVAFIAAAASAAAKAAETDAFYKASYLQTEERDFEAAAKLFAEVAESDATPAKIRAAAKRRLAECRDELAAEDLASLMPAESILYVQLANVGPQATVLLKSLGITREEGASEAESSRIPIEPGLSIPTNIGLSPALVREIAKLGGVAAAMTGLDERGMPEGVVVVHLGGSDLVRGLIETGLQIVEPNDAISDYSTYRIPVEGENLWLVKTERLLVLSNSREQVASAVGRISAGEDSDSLKNAEAFKKSTESRGENLVFVWADPQRAAPMIDAAMAQEMNRASGQEVAAVRSVLNLQQVEGVTFSIGATDGGFRSHASVRFTPGHQHLLYGLVRTAPIGEEAFRHVPATAGAVVAIGLNPPLAGGNAKREATPQLALMDIGRELFANVRSISVFVTPGEGAVPEVGLIVYAQDSEKSKQLWGRLMALPAQFGLLPAEAVRDSELRGHTVTQYQYPDAPPIFVTQPSNESMLVGTAGAVEASLAALDDGESLGSADEGAKLAKRLNPATSKAVILRGGQLLKCAAPAMGEHERREIAAIAPLLTDLTAALTVDEEPDQLRIEVDITGIPKVGDVLRAVSGRQPESTAPAEVQAAVTR